MGFWNLLGGLANAGASVYSQVQTNKNIDKQLAAQKQENEATREYNMNLAKQQNQWNIEQWNRENAYNTPSAQKQRIQDAGLNADMLYGQGTLQNTAASSPQMTSGAAATPMDWSALGSKRAVGDTVINDVLQQELLRAQIDKIKSETEGQTISNDIQDFEREIVEVMREEGYKGTFAYARVSLEEYTAKLAKQNFTSEIKKYEFIEEQLRHNKVVNEFEESLNEKRREQFNALVRQAVASANIMEFVDSMKKLDFWTEKGIDATQAIVGAIGALKGFKVPSSTE